MFIILEILQLTKMNKSLEDNILKLKSAQGLIQSLTDLLSFPGSEYLNPEKLDEDIKLITSFVDNPEFLKQLVEIKNEYISNEQQELMIEFARLFVGPFHVIAPPYGSYYLEEGKLMGDSTFQVSKLYDSTGLAINESFKDLPDHVVAESEFLLFLIHNEIQFLLNGVNENLQTINNIKKEFFNRFYYSWIKEFSKVIINNSRLEFYRKVGTYLNLVVDELKNEINRAHNLN
jgi:TorA maturation chaperone TorD